MPVNAPPRDALANRQARPLNGMEVANAIENHLLVMSTKLTDGEGILSDELLPLQDSLRADFRTAITYQSRLTKINVTYPRVGWSIKLRLQEVDETTSKTTLTAEIEVDLERGVRLNLRVGTGAGVVLSSLEEEKIPTQIPDKDRQKFGLPITAEFLKPDGTVGKVDLNELKPQEKRAARTVDVGSGAKDRHSYQLPTQNEKGQIVTTEVLVSKVAEGEVIVLPHELPEVTLDDLVATPPQPEKAPLEQPLPPPNSMSKITRPNVKFKR